jgi:DNA polymerase delta subunit 3
MAQDYNEYLAANILNEQQYVRTTIPPIESDTDHTQVTYRLLSRALKVHSNLAKQ